MLYHLLYIFPEIYEYHASKIFPFCHEPFFVQTKALLSKCMTHWHKQVAIRSQVWWVKPHGVEFPSRVLRTAFAICDGTLSWRSDFALPLSVFWPFFISKWFKLVNCCWQCLVLTVSPDFNSSQYFLASFHVPCLQHQNHHFWNSETIVHT